MFYQSAANSFQSGLITFPSALIIHQSSLKTFPTTLQRYMSGLEDRNTAIYQDNLLKKSPTNFSLLRTTIHKIKP